MDFAVDSLSGYGNPDGAWRNELHGLLNDTHAEE